MNIVVVDESELGKPLSLDDRRTHHIIHNLHKQPGDRVKAGVVNRSLGWLHITHIDSGGMHYNFAPSENASQSRYPITMLIGHPRPPATRRLLIDLTALGVTQMVFFCADNSEKSYMHSSLWHSTTTAQLLRRGLEYAGATGLPSAVVAPNLAAGLRTVDTLHSATATHPPYRWCCITPSDHMDTEHPTHLHTTIHHALQRHTDDTHPHIILAIGAERGWTANELTTLAAHHFTPCIIGQRTIRTETAAVGAVTMVIASLTSR